LEHAGRRARSWRIKYVSEQLAKPADAMNQLLGGMKQFDASDLHLKVGYAPYYRIAGHLRKTHLPPMPTTEYVYEMVHPLIPEQRREEFERSGALDFSTQAANGDRFRVNVFRACGEIHASIRRVKSEIPSFEELHLPPVYDQVAAKTIDGLVLICGITGSGKSSTMAAIVQRVNELRGMHVVTIEDPVEFQFHPKKSIISQREIGVDVANFAEALRHVVRQDPDCIMIGEVRDKETMNAALQAAETGHLVLGSLHVSDAQQSFTRILEFFPRGVHGFVRGSIANSLRAIMCQRLIPGIDENSRYPVTEVLLNTPMLRDKIMREEDDDIPGIIQAGTTDGMRSFTKSLVELVESDKIYFDTALEYAPNREAFKSAMKGINSGGGGLMGGR